MELRRGCEANLVGTRSPRRAEKSTIALSNGEAELVAALSGACERMSLRQQWNWLLKFGCNAEETNESTQQILSCDSSAALGMIKRKGSTRKTKTYRVESVLLTTMQRSTRCETCFCGDERNAFGLFNRDTVDTKFGTSLEASNSVLNRVELGRNDRSGRRVRKFHSYFRLFCGCCFSHLFFPFSVARITHSTMNSELTFWVHTVFLC